MPFILPTFNLTVFIWRFAADPHTDPPDVVTAGQLRWPGATGLAINAVPGLEPGMILLLPPSTDIREGNPSIAVSDWVEVPAGTGRLYYPLRVDDVARGFSNQHRFAVLSKILPWPQPTP